MDILAAVKAEGRLDNKALSKIIHQHDKGLAAGSRPFSKKRILPYYLKVKESDPDLWNTWDIDPELEKKLLETLRMKPRRTASGVATITVLTKPWPCSSACVYCPNDVRMPKSYLSDEPACQRAERNYFDPYLQVVSRLRALTHMGHPTDKIELIILGGTWSDYPSSYQTWFVCELFRALNDGEEAERNARERRTSYRLHGLSSQAEDLAKFTDAHQAAIDAGHLTYNRAVEVLYGDASPWRDVAEWQTSDFDMLASQQYVNEGTQHRVVGLVVETRPDAITAETLTLLRRLGCTKVQMGIQSLDPSILKTSNRRIDVGQISNAFDLARVFGFKMHVHAMVNLPGSTPTSDKQDYEQLVSDPRFLPDEVKLYPCVLVSGTALGQLHADGRWRPYREDELVDVLTTDLTVTPPYMRISRMIRDISAHDIVAGNRKTNLRQLVERQVKDEGEPVSEIRYREISTGDVDVDSLSLSVLSYETTVSDERFLQWVTEEDRIAGFLRLSLPKEDYLLRNQASLPVGLQEAMIREVHIYGRTSELHESGAGAQHLGLGRKLVEKACDLARGRGYRRINVISSVGTRGYYRKLGFEDNGLYQRRDL